MARRVEFANYGHLIATSVWTLGWVVSTVLAAERLTRSSDPSSVVGFVTAAAFASAGTWMVFRMRATTNADGPETPTLKESWSRRIVGWFAAIVWCGAGVIWNITIIGLQLHMAYEGRGGSMLIIIPWSLIGWFLLCVLFVGLGVLVDSVVSILRKI